MGLNLFACACVCTCAHSWPCRGGGGDVGAFLGSSLSPQPPRQAPTLSWNFLICAGQWNPGALLPLRSSTDITGVFCTIWLFTWIRGDQNVGPEVCVLSSWASPVNAHSDKCFIYCFKSSKFESGMVTDNFNPSTWETDRWIFSLRPDGST